MYNYKVKLHTGETFTFSCDTPLDKLLDELNSCIDGYMLFGSKMRQKSAILGIDLESDGDTTGEEIS